MVHVLVTLSSTMNPSSSFLEDASALDPSSSADSDSPQAGTAARSEDRGKDCQCVGEE